MFTFKVEDGSGLSDSTSYVALADANDYFVIDPNSAAWSALPDDAAKQRQLSWATRILDQKTRWKGSKTVADSALRWPRSGVTDRDANPVDSDVIPIQVKQATLELTKFLLSNDLTVGADVDYLKLVKIDVIELEYQDKTGQPVLPSLINEILMGLGYIANGGPRFVPILKT